MERSPSRIGLVTPGFSESEEDWCIPALLDLVRELSRHHEVWVLTLRYPHRPGVYTVAGATVEALGAAQSRGLVRGVLVARALRAIGRQHGRRPFDVLHGLWAHEPGFLVGLAGRLLGIPRVVSLLGGELERLPEISYGGQTTFAGRRLVAFALRSATRVTAGSRSLRRRAERVVPPARVEDLKLGVDVERFTPRGGGGGAGVQLAGARKILHVASLVPVKDQGTLLEAFARVRERDPGVHLHLVGEGSERPALERKAEERGVSEWVSFHGAVPHHELPAFYREADLCVLSSRFESQGMVVLEAAACGRVTVGTRVGMLPELEPECRTVDVGDSQGLAALLLETLEEGPGLRRRGESVRRRVEECWSVERCVSRLSSLYERAIARGVDDR